MRDYRTKYNYKIEYNFSLLELVIVLGILTAITAIAIGSMDNLMSRNKVLDNQHLINQVEECVIGNRTQSSAFMEDMGRFPVARTGDGELFSLPF